MIREFTQSQSHNNFLAASGVGPSALTLPVTDIYGTILFVL